jgi:predicted nucleic acid-binding protein
VVLVDANALLDILTADPVWSAWSQGAMMEAAAEGLAINPIIYSELAPAFREERELAAALADWPLQQLPLPYEAAWPAVQAFAAYRNRGGMRTAPFADFYIGAHAQVDGLTLLTRDPARYRTYFPRVALICPSEDSPAVG